MATRISDDDEIYLVHYYYHKGKSPDFGGWGVYPDQGPGVSTETAVKVLGIGGFTVKC